MAQKFVSREEQGFQQTNLRCSVTVVHPLFVGGCSDVGFSEGVAGRDDATQLTHLGSNQPFPDPISLPILWPVYPTWHHSVYSWCCGEVSSLVPRGATYLGVLLGFLSKLLSGKFSENVLLLDPFSGPTFLPIYLPSKWHRFYRAKAQVGLFI